MGDLAATEIGFASLLETGVAVQWGTSPVLKPVMYFNSSNYSCHPV